MQLGVRQARYVGRTKTLCQLLLAATVPNLTLVATRVGLMRDRNHIRAYLSHQLFMSTAILDAIRCPFLVQARPELLPRGGFSATLLGVFRTAGHDRGAILLSKRTSSKTASR